MKNNEKDCQTVNLINNANLYLVTNPNEVAEYDKVSPFEIIVKFKDGTAWLYDDRTNGSRSIPYDSNEMTEEEQTREFGIRLRTMMWSKGITQKELAEKTGIQQSLLSDYVRGKKKPSFYKVDKIARALECSVDDFRYL